MPDDVTVRERTESRLPADECAVTELVGLQAAVRFAERADGRTSVHHPWGVHVVRGITPATREVLRRLSTEPVESSRLSADPEYRPVARFFAGFPFLAVRTVLAGGVAVLRLDPLAEAARTKAGPLGAEARLRLSRFALCRRRGDEFVVESPLSAYRAALLLPELAGLVAMLAEPCSPRELAAGAARQAGGRRLPDIAVRALVHELAAVGLVDVGAPGGAGAAFPEDGDPSLQTWSFHDLLFHTRSRAGRYDAPSGATFPGLGRVRPLPVVKPPVGGDVVALPRPDLTEVASRDVTFTEVLESRSTRRSHGPRGISVAQLAELLYRSLRVKEHWSSQAVGYRDEATGEVKTDHYELSRRPYPSGGSCHEFEVYLAVHRCDGLDAGVYHYDALRHELRRLHGPGDKLTELLGWYRPRLVATPDVLLVITSRFRRMSWKYESISYAVTLRNVGVLYQTLYLVATSMGLAACALGDGDTAVAERVLGLPFTAESSVGEFAVGSLAPPSAAPGDQPPVRSRRPVNDADWALAHSRLLRSRQSGRPTPPPADGLRAAAPPAAEVPGSPPGSS